jgi:hypothetical protein
MVLDAAFELLAHSGEHCSATAVFCPCRTDGAHASFSSAMLVASTARGYTASYGDEDQSMSEMLGRSRF